MTCQTPPLSNTTHVPLHGLFIVNQPPVLAGKVVLGFSSASTPQRPKIIQLNVIAISNIAEGEILPVKDTPGLAKVETDP